MRSRGAHTVCVLGGYSSYSAITSPQTLIQTLCASTVTVTVYQPNTISPTEIYIMPPLAPANLRLHDPSHSILLRPRLCQSIFTHKTSAMSPPPHLTIVAVVAVTLLTFISSSAAISCQVPPYPPTSRCTTQTSVFLTGVDSVTLSRTPLAPFNKTCVPPSPPRCNAICLNMHAQKVRACVSNNAEKAPRIACRFSCRLTTPKTFNVCKRVADRQRDLCHANCDAGLIVSSRRVDTLLKKYVVQTQLQASVGAAALIDEVTTNLLKRAKKVGGKISKPQIIAASRFYNPIVFTPRGPIRVNFVELSGTGPTRNLIRNYATTILGPGVLTEDGFDELVRRINIVFDLVGRSAERNDEGSLSRGPEYSLSEFLFSFLFGFGLNSARANIQKALIAAFIDGYNRN